MCVLGERLKAAILFVVIRADAVSFRPNVEACPSFAKHLRAAHGHGVKVMAYRIAWGNAECNEKGNDPEMGNGLRLGRAFFDGAIKVDL